MTRVSLCTVPDYLGMVLTGRKTSLLHLSNAASLGFFDTEKGCFLEKELFLAGADLVASGNGYRRNEMLQKISSEMFHAELVLAAYNEEAACGAILVSAGLFFPGIPLQS